MAKYRPKLTLEIVPFTGELMDGIDFISIGEIHKEFPKIIMSMTRNEYLSDTKPTPKTSSRYFINTVRGKEYFNETEYVAFGMYGKFKVTEEEILEYDLVEE